jgi:hypothetical protein
MRPIMNIEYTVQIWKERNQFIAHAMPLDVMSSGKTAEEARKAPDDIHWRDLEKFFLKPAFNSPGRKGAIVPFIVPRPSSDDT